MAPYGPVQYLSHSGVALHQRCRYAVKASDAEVVRLTHQRCDGGVRGIDLAEGRQYVADVGQETVVGSDDQPPRARKLLAERVEQIGGAVQADRGLSGARRALDAE